MTDQNELPGLNEGLGGIDKPFVKRGERNPDTQTGALSFRRFIPSRRIVRREHVPQNRENVFTREANKFDTRGTTSLYTGIVLSFPITPILWLHLVLTGITTTLTLPTIITWAATIGIPIAFATWLYSRRRAASIRKEGGI